MKYWCHQISDFLAKCVRFDLCWGYAPDPTQGAYSTPPDSLAALNIAP